MKFTLRIIGIAIIALIMLLCVRCAFSQTSGPTVPPPPYCTSSNAGALYTYTGTNPKTVYTCSYYNLSWQWVVNPSYGGLVYYPTLPSTCAGSLPVFLAGWPTNTKMYVCVNGFPVPVGTGGSYTLPIATTSTLGGVKPDGTNCVVNGTTGVLTCAGTGGGGSPIPAGATIALAGNSALGDDGNLLGLPQITITAINCNGTVCICTNSGTNGLAAGDWVDMGTVSSPNFLTATYAGSYTTGGTLFEVISTGLTATQFEFSYTANTGTGTGGTINTANGYLSSVIANLPTLASKGTFFTAYALIGDLATVAAGGGGRIYPTYYHPISPAVTGKPGYLILMGDPDIFIYASGYCKNLAGYQTLYQSVWNQAHTDGWTVIQATTPFSVYYNQYVSCHDGDGEDTINWQQLNSWIRGQRKTPETLSAGYYDALIDLEPIVDSNTGETPYVEGAAYNPTGVSLVGGLINQVVGNFGLSAVAPATPCHWYTNCFNLNENNAPYGSTTFSRGGATLGTSYFYLNRTNNSTDYVLTEWPDSGLGRLYNVRINSANSGYANIPMYVFAEYGNTSATASSSNYTTMGFAANAVISWGAITGTGGVNGSTAYTGDTGLSRLSAGTLALGNNQWGDYTGTLKLAHIITTDCTGCGGGSSPLTTKGDLYGFSTVAARIPVGTDGYYLQADSTQTLGVKWAAGGSGIANVTFSTDTTPISANSCRPTAGSGGTSVTMTGLTSSMTLNVTPTTDTSNVRGWGAPTSTVLYLDLKPGSGAFVYYVCNNSSSSVTPDSSVTWNVSAK